MKVLVTRPAPEAARTAAVLAVRGHASVVAPILRIRHLAPEIPSLGYQAVLVTSANAVRALVAHRRIAHLRDRPLLAVGEATAEAARAAGFGEVCAAGGTAVELASLAVERLDPGAGPLLYASARDVARDISADLAAAGFEAHRLAVYEAVAVSQLPGPAREALRQGALDAALLYSPRSAELLGSLAAAAGLGREVAGLCWICLSPAVAEAARRVGASSLVTASCPDEEALLDALDAVAAEGGGLATSPRKRV